MMLAEATVTAAYLSYQWIVGLAVVIVIWSSWATLAWMAMRRRRAIWDKAKRRPSPCDDDVDDEDGGTTVVP